MNDRITALEEALEFYADQSAWTQPPVKTRDGILSVEYENQASKMQRDRGDIARAALAASRAATDCQQPDLVTAAQVSVKPLEWTGWWCIPCRSVGMVHCSDPERCGCMLTVNQEADSWKSWLDDLPLDEDFSHGIDRLQDFITRILAALDLTPATAVEPVADNSPQRAVSEIGNQIHNIACELHGNEDVQERLGALASEAWRISVTLSQATPAPTAQDAARVPEIAALIEAARALRADMLERAQMGLDVIHGEQYRIVEYRIVNAGRTAWADFDAALRAIGGDA